MKVNQNQVKSSCLTPPHIIVIVNVISKPKKRDIFLKKYLFLLTLM